MRGGASPSRRAEREACPPAKSSRDLGAEALAGSLSHHGGPHERSRPCRRCRSGIHRREHRACWRLPRRLLVWIAQRLPLAINADHLTALGAAAIVGIAASFAAAPCSEWALLGVPFFLALNWLATVSITPSPASAINGARATFCGSRRRHRERDSLQRPRRVETRESVDCGVSSWAICCSVPSRSLPRTRSGSTISFSGFGPTGTRILLASARSSPFGVLSYGRSGWLTPAVRCWRPDRTIAMLIVFVITAVGMPGPCSASR